MVVNGDRPATSKSTFERMVRENYAVVASYLRRRLYPLPTSDLDDLVEDVLVVVWRRLGEVPEGNETAWIIGVARNVLANAKRRFNVADAYRAGQRPLAASASAEDAVVADMVVSSALQELSPDEREILMLHYWDGLAARDIAISLLISENAAAIRLTRALSRFREILLAQQDH